VRVWLTPVETPESPPDLADGCLRLPAVVLAEMKEGDRKLAGLTAQDVEEALKAICAHPTYALGRPFPDFARKVETAVA
jgi:hypothetical protein